MSSIVRLARFIAESPDIPVEVKRLIAVEMIEILGDEIDNLVKHATPVRFIDAPKR